MYEKNDIYSAICVKLYVFQKTNYIINDFWYHIPSAWKGYFSLTKLDYSLGNLLLILKIEKNMLFLSQTNQFPVLTKKSNLNIN